MAVTITTADAGELPYYIEGNRKKTIKDITFSGTYATGGVDVTAANLGLNHIDHAHAVVRTPANATDALSSVSFSRTSGQAGKLIAYDNSPAQITAADTVTNTVVRVTAFGY